MKKIIQIQEDDNIHIPSKTAKSTKNNINLKIITEDSTKNDLELENQQTLLAASKSSKSSIPINFTKYDVITKKPSIEDYEIIQTLGKGSYATVYLAKNKENNMYIALKGVKKKFIEKVVILFIIL